MILCGVCLCFAGLAARAQTPVPPHAADNVSQPVDIQADRLESRDNNRVLVAVGNVLVTHGDSVFRADRMTYNTETYVISGEGNIDVRHEGRTYQGDTFEYNTKTRVGDFQSMDMREGPWILTADSTERLGPDKFRLHNARITTCEGDNPEYYVRARTTEVLKDDRLRSEHVFVYLGGIPIFYTPRATRDLQSDSTNIDVIPGYSSRMGGFVLTAYNYGLTEWLDASTRVDYRSRRGMAYGQDFNWRDWGDETYEGRLRGYYMPEDDRPYEDLEDEAATGDLVDEERWRIQLRDRRKITDADTLRVRGDYLSDPDVLEDFFDREVRYNTQPENYITLTHRDRDYSASVKVNQKLNDFYNNVNRIPEFTLDVPRLQLGSASPFYYTSRNSASFLEASFADQLNREDFDSGRIDSLHEIRYYTRHWGWLNLIPRVGYAGTYYSEVPRTVSVTNLVASTNELGEVATSGNVSTTVEDGGSDFRNVFELGVETSYKAFNLIHDDPRGGADVGFRHVVEPFANYTFVPEPNVEPEELFPFDGIDQRDEVNDLYLGVRNKWQTKRRGRVHDLVDVNTYTIVNVDKADTETDTVEFLALDGEIRWIQRLWIDVDGRYDMVQDELAAFNTQVSYRWLDQSTVSFEHRYVEQSRDLFAGLLTVFPEGKWSYSGYVRYNSETSETEEHSHFVIHRTDCLGIGIGVKDVDNDVTVWGQIWLLALPRSVAEIGR